LAGHAALLIIGENAIGAVDVLSRFLSSKTASRRRLWIGVLGVVALTVLIVVLANRGESVDPGAELQAAEQALWQDDLAAARLHLDRVLHHSPDHPHAHFLAIKVARRTDAVAEAERLLITFELSQGASAKTSLEWALLGAQQGDLAGEDARLQNEARSEGRDTAEILEAMAKGYDASYQWPEAIDVLSALLQRRPDHVPALILRGKLLARIRQPHEGERDLRKAVEKAPGNAAAHAALADVLNRLGHTREAIYHYELALRDRPAPARTRLGLARALTDAAQLDEAIRHLDELLVDDPNHADGLVERGRLALRRKQYAEAESFLDRAIASARWHRDGHLLRLAVLKELKKTEAAAQCEARIAELKSEDALLGKLKLRARDNPTDINVRWELWVVSRRNGLMEEGFAWLTEILRTDPRHVQTHAAMADHFFRAGQPRRAAQHQAMAGNRAGAKP
jgi:tetratricopeptide (TPR) repeat protein